LKSLTNADGTKRWSVSDLNTIPIGGQAIQVVFGEQPSFSTQQTILTPKAVWIWAFLSDRLKTRYTLIVAQAVIGLIPCIIMTIWSVPDGAKYFGYFTSFIALGTAPLIFAWVCIIFRT
jgi:hypothetical protein